MEDYYIKLKGGVDWSKPLVWLNQDKETQYDVEILDTNVMNNNNTLCAYLVRLTSDGMPGTKFIRFIDANGHDVTKEGVGVRYIYNYVGERDAVQIVPKRIEIENPEKVKQLGEF